MKPPLIEAIVEGDGERQAVPVLLRRILGEILPGIPCDIGQGWKMPRERLLRNNEEMRKALDILAKGVKSRQGGILVLWDADDDLPCEQAPVQLARLTAMRSDVRIAVVIASREYESWFLAAASSIAGVAGLDRTVSDLPTADRSPRDAKSWLTARMPDGQPYKETVHQRVFSTALDFAIARRNSASFDKLCRELIRLAAR